MPRFRVVHTIRCRFAEPVRQAELELRLTPHTTARQALEQHELQSEPEAELAGSTDGFGNACHHLRLTEPFGELVVTATSTVLLEPPEPSADLRARALTLLSSAGVDLRRSSGVRAKACQERSEAALARLAACDVGAHYCAGYPSRPGRRLPHAWIELELPDGARVGFDPTSGRLAPSHVLVAMGQGHADTTPITGKLVASGRYSLASRVHVQQLPP